MNRGQDAGAHQEGADERQREGEDGEKDGPDLQRIALLDDDRRMQKCGSHEPGHEGGVLDRIPEPEAAPAQFVIGPPRAHGDADGEEHPGGERPGPDPARPGGIDLAVDQSGNREGEGDRKADIARIEKGRMEGERRVLQQRIEAIPFDRRRIEAQEGIGAGDDEQKKGGADRSLDRQDARFELKRQIVAEQGDCRAEQREDQHPQHHRAFMVPPDARNLVEQRLRRMRVLPDIGEREIRRHIGMHQRQEGDDDQRKLRQGGGRRDTHQSAIALGRAVERHQELHQRRRQRQDEREMAGLGDHGPAPLPSFHTPFSFRRSATSFGM